MVGLGLIPWLFVAVLGPVSTSEHWFANKETRPDELEKRYANQQYEIELLIVADYSFFISWFDKTNDTSSSDARRSEAKHLLRQYVGALINGANVVYKSLELHNIHLQIKLVDIFIATTPVESPWTETIKIKGSPTDRVVSTEVLKLFQPGSVKLQSTIPHDHAMILTALDLSDETGLSVMAGYAYMDAECKAKSVSVVEDNRDFYTAQLIAHEIGHSLGASHDGVGNMCVQGYAMEGTFLFHNKYKWIFSSCSVNYIRNYLDFLNRNGTNCLTTTENHSHITAEIMKLTHQQYGKLFSADEQCRIVYGKESYLCRHLYHDIYSYNDICLRLFCYHPKNQTCFYIDAGNGTPCGKRKSCYASECVTTNQVPNTYSATCPVGDQEGIVKNGMTCPTLVSSDSSHCANQTIRYACCASCDLNKNDTLAYVSNMSIDQQCASKVGVGSLMCRGGSAYENVTYSDTVCGDMQCLNPRNPTMCISVTADDGTLCGNKKWCINGVCIHDDRSPAVSGTCPWGDVPGVVSYGLTCSDLLQTQYQWRCYDKFIGKMCCATCDSLRTNRTGCPYGDKSDWCTYNIRSENDKTECYIGNNAELCCGTCHKYRTSDVLGCTFGDHLSWCASHIQSRSDSYVCYYGNEDLCCESCRKYRNSSNTGCEYGDKVKGCHESDCARYPVETRTQCCESCMGISAVLIG